jgi:hypothetical protein
VLTCAQAVAAAAEEFAVSPPAANADGDTVFALEDGFSFGVHGVPGGGLVTWTRVAEAGGGAGEGAERFLGVHPERFRRGACAVATRGDDGSLVLFIRSRPESAAEWLDAVAELLNEAEAARRHLAGRDAPNFAQ